ncbi:MAG: TonB-dependent receptor [Brumimicrobium sp.]|nr:TonB-dependent receptor [Brumimicrobium sp.]
MKFVCTLLIFFLPVYFFAQGELLLTINDETGKPIEYAGLRLFSKADSSVVDGAYSTPEGQIILQNIPYGDYYGVITFFGYNDEIIENIVLSKSQKKVDLGSVQLTKLKGQEFEEVVIEGETPLMETGIDKRVYNVEEDMTTMGGGLTDLLNNIPSVEVDNDGNIYLRGNSSVRILIDGRPSAMAGGEGSLEGIPASAIERIELITNPSAKYDPDGTAGIINIILKKKKLRGVNTNIDLTAASENLYNASIGFNARNEKLNFYANYSFRYREGFRNNFNERTGFYEDTVEFLDQRRLGTDLSRAHTLKIGTDFFIKDNQVLGISISGTDNDRIRTGDQINYLSFNGELDRYWERFVYDPRMRRSLDLNADYKLDFKEDKGSFIAAVTQSVGDEVSEGRFEEYFYRPDGSPYSEPYRFQNQIRTEEESAFTASADLVRKINDKMNIETGLKAIINADLETNYLEYYDTISDQVLPDPTVNNEMKFDEQILSFYTIFGHKVREKFRYQGGLRLEQAFTQPRLLTTNEDFENNYFSFFPSLHLVYGDKKMGEIFASYSRRINRPGAYQLNPFPEYSDPLNLRQGNPALQPEYINSYELGYEKIWDKLSLTNSLYFKQTVDRIQRIRQFYDDGLSVTTFANVAESYDYGIEIIGTYSPFDWWKNMISFNGFESRLSANVGGLDLRNRGFSWDMKLNSTFYLWNDLSTIQVNAEYIAPRYTVQGVYQRNPGIDIGVTRLLLNKKLNIGLRVTDVFDQKSFYMEINNENFEQVTLYKWTTRRIYFTLSYKFGNLGNDDRKKESQKGGGDSDESE